MVDQEGRKQHEQIGDGEHEQPVSSAAIGSNAPVQLECEQQGKAPRRSRRSRHRSSLQTRAPRAAPRPEPGGRCRSGSAALLQPVPRQPAASARLHAHSRQLRLSARAQKWGGVQRKIMRNSASGSSPISPVAAAHPITGGSAPAAPPMTMFCGVARFSHAVYTTT